MKTHPDCIIDNNNSSIIQTFFEMQILVSSDLIDESLQIGITLIIDSFIKKPLSTFKWAKQEHYVRVELQKGTWAFFFFF